MDKKNEYFCFSSKKWNHHNEAKKIAMQIMYNVKQIISNIHHLQPFVQQNNKQ